MLLWQRAAAANATRQLSCLATFVAHADAVLKRELAQFGQRQQSRR